ncbi:TPA: hypothetical protein U2C79_000466 [Streptococcus suis]|nr:hypothetical protein [Streptococcus suis]
MRKDSQLFKKVILELSESISESEIRRIRPNVNEELVGLWAMYGMRKEEPNDKEVCIEIGSSKNIYEEIRSIVRAMISKSEKKMANSYFHENVYEFETYSDKHSVKCRSIFKNFKNIKIYKVDIVRLVGDDLADQALEEFIEFELNYAEVKLALFEEPIYWNPAPSTNKNKERKILRKKNLIRKKFE